MNADTLKLWAILNKTLYEGYGRAINLISCPDSCKSLGSNSNLVSNWLEKRKPHIYLLAIPYSTNTESSIYLVF